LDIERTGWEIVEWNGFQCMRVMGTWTPQIEMAFWEHRPEGLVLINGKFWTDSNIEFIRTLPGCLHLTVTKWSEIDLSPISQITTLKSLSLGTRSSTNLDFSGLDSLEECAVHWMPGLAGVLDLKSLRQLSIVNLPKAQVSRLSGQKLESLQILGCSAESLDPVGGLSNLHYLRLALCSRLTGIGFLSHMTRLEEMYIQSCRGFRDLTPLASLPGLRKVVLEDMGDIESLAPLASMPSLEWFSLIGRSRLLGGDLSPIQQCHRLKHLTLPPYREVSLG
jgi:hypothetical protein